MNDSVPGSATSRLLERPIPASHLRERTRQIDAPESASEPDAYSVIVFRIASEWLALPTDTVEEVVGRRATHTLPHHNRGPVLGITNIRGELLVCISLARVLALDAAAANEKEEKLGEATRRLLVLKRDGWRVVCPVYEVCGVERFSARELREPPATLARAAVTYTKGVLPWHQKQVGVLDEQLLFHTFGRSLSSST